MGKVKVLAALTVLMAMAAAEATLLPHPSLPRHRHDQVLWARVHRY